MGGVCRILRDRRNFGEQKTQEKVQSDTAQDDGQITDIKVGVKPQGHGGQKEACQLILPEPVKPVPSDQCDGKKYENKNVGVK